MNVDFVTMGNFTIDDVIYPGSTVRRQCGGDCLYSAVGARLWSERVAVVSVIGEDYPSSWLDDLHSAGIDTCGVRKVAGSHWASGAMEYTEDGQRRVWISSGGERVEIGQQTAQDRSLWRAYSPAPEHIPADYLQARGFHLAPMPVERHAENLAFLERVPAFVTLDSPWWHPEQDRSTFLPMLHSVDALLPSEQEIEDFFGSLVTTADAIRRLHAFGPPVTVVKCGSRGSLVYDGRSDHLWTIPTYPIAVKDPTGAGDAFCGGFLVGMTETGDPRCAALYGTVSASFVIEEFGGLYALQFTRHDAERRLQELAALAPINRDLGPS